MKKIKILLFFIMSVALTSCGDQSGKSELPPETPEQQKVIVQQSQGDQTNTEAGQPKDGQQEADAQAKKTNGQQQADAKKEADAKAKQEADAKAKKEADAKAKQEADAKAKQEADAKAKQEADAKAKKEADAKGEQGADAKAKQEADAKAKQEADAKINKEITPRTGEKVCEFRDDYLKGNLSFSGEEITVSSLNETFFGSEPFGSLPQILRMIPKQASTLDDIISAFFDTNDFEKVDETLSEVLTQNEPSGHSELISLYTYNPEGPYNDWCLVEVSQNTDNRESNCEVEVTYTTGDTGEIRQISSNYFQSRGDLTVQINFNGRPLDFSGCE